MFRVIQGNNYTLKMKIQVKDKTWKVMILTIIEICEI